MIDVIRYLIRESGRPEAQSSPWDAATYAVGKVFAAAILVAFSHIILLSVTGVVAGKMVIALGPLIVAYGWEFRQGWVGRDTVFDLAFWKIGIFGTVLSFDENEKLQYGPFLASTAVLAVALLALVALKLRAISDAK